jgi:hypothetical protein
MMRYFLCLAAVLVVAGCGGSDNVGEAQDKSAVQATTLGPRGRDAVTGTADGSEDDQGDDDQGDGSDAGDPTFNAAATKTTLGPRGRN